MENRNYANNSGVMANDIAGSVSITNNIYKNVKRLPSVMPKFIEKLAELLDSDDIPVHNQENKNVYEIEDKIRHNKLKIYKEIVDDYGEYCYICNVALSYTNKAYINSKKKILREVSEIYKSKKRTITARYEDSEKSNLEIIRENSDKIIELVKDELIEKIRLNYEDENILEEDLSLCASIFVCYCFVECKILERPEK